MLKVNGARMNGLKAYKKLPNSKSKIITFDVVQGDYMCSGQIL